MFRLFVKEPMRTTFRVYLPPEQHFDPVPFLSTPIKEVVGLDGSFSLREDLTVSGADVLRRMEELKGTRLEHLFAAYGFRRFEVIGPATQSVGQDLPVLGKGNVKWMGSSE
jgi:hypothetical protein